MTVASIEERFADFHRQHPDVYDEFVRLARQLRAAGRGHYSADAVCHVIRYHRATSGPDAAGFKINNNFVALYARKAMAEHPDLDGFFHLRERRAA